MPVIDGRRHRGCWALRLLPKIYHCTKEPIAKKMRTRTASLKHGTPWDWGYWDCTWPYRTGFMNYCNQDDIWRIYMDKELVKNYPAFVYSGGKKKYHMLHTELSAVKNVKLVASQIHSCVMEMWEHFYWAFFYMHVKEAITFLYSCEFGSVKVQFTFYSYLYSHGVLYGGHKVCSVGRCIFSQQMKVQTQWNVICFNSFDTETKRVSSREWLQVAAWLTND